MWYFNNVEITVLPPECAGYVYCITNLTSNRKYIGKKLASFAKTSYKTIKQKNGIKKRKKIRSRVESDWKSYFGSSVELSKDVESMGTHNFKREILYICNSKAECSYIEAKLQFEFKVLESDDYYNGQISVRCHQSHIKGKLSNLSSTHI